MFSLIPLKVLVRLRVILPELLHNILTHITIVLLHLPSHLQLVLRRNSSHLTTLSHEVEHELGDIATGDGYVLDGGADDIALSTGNDVSDTVSGIDNGAGESAVCDAVRGPGSCECENGLDGDVETFDVEGLEEDFGGLFSILGWIERRFSL